MISSINPSNCESILPPILPPELNRLTASYAREPRHVIFLRITELLMPSHMNHQIRRYQTAASDYSKDTIDGFCRTSEAACAHFDAFVETARQTAEVAIVIADDPFIRGSTAAEVRNSVTTYLAQGRTALGAVPPGAPYAFVQHIIGNTAEIPVPTEDRLRETLLMHAAEFEATDPSYAAGIDCWLRVHPHQVIDNFAIVIGPHTAEATALFPNHVVSLDRIRFSPASGERLLGALNPPLAPSAVSEPLERRDS